MGLDFDGSGFELGRGFDWAGFFCEHMTGFNGY